MSQDAAQYSPDDSGPEQEPGMQRRRRSRRSAQKPTTFWGSVKEMAVVVVLALLIAFVVKTLFIRGYYIPSGSMENTLQLNDRIFVNVMGANLGKIDRGDIVVFNDTKGWLPAQPQSQPSAKGAVREALSFVGVLPDSSEQALVKRVIGVGGDHVVCCDAEGRVSVNGTSLDETYLYPGANPSDIPFDVIVPDGHYFVLGDHRNASADSRVHLGSNDAFISKKDVVGTAFVTAWPLDRFHWIKNPTEVFASVAASPSGQ